MADVIALCVDGTLKGQVQAMPRAGYVMIEYADIHGAAVRPHQVEFGMDYILKQVLYRPHRLSMFNKIIWVATCSGEWPSDDVMIELLFSDVAKSLMKVSE